MCLIFRIFEVRFFRIFESRLYSTFFKIWLCILFTAIIAYVVDGLGTRLGGRGLRSAMNTG